MIQLQPPSVLDTLNAGTISGLLSVGYMLTKAGIKTAVRALLDLSYDPMDTVSWFPVDVVVLAITLSYASHIHKNWSEMHIVFWYALLVVALIVCIFSYAFFITRRSKKRVVAFFALALALFVSISPFITVMRSLTSGG